jgi:hypothetical protein
MQDDAAARADAPALADVTLESLYLRWLETAKDPLVEALIVVAEPTSHPLVFHCAAGKDRTGLVAALVLDLLGVGRETIVADYALTATRLDLIRARQRLDPETAKRMDEAPQIFGAEAETMERFLDGLDARYGGARQWALTAGISKGCLDVMHDVLLVDDD